MLMDSTSNNDFKFLSQEKRHDILLVTFQLQLLARNHFVLLCTYHRILMAEEETKCFSIFQKFSLANTQG